MNEKGGVADVKFEKYIDNSIIPLYPDLEDTPGKRVLLKVDSGPGRNGREFLVKCRFRGRDITPACQMPPPCNRRLTSTMVRSSLLFATTSEKYRHVDVLSGIDRSAT